jgi:hypothetical protein
MMCDLGTLPSSVHRHGAGGKIADKIRTNLVVKKWCADSL